MCDANCLVEFAEPNRSMLGNHMIRKAKREYINWLSAGLTPAEATVEIGRDTRVVESWRLQDASFDSACERAIEDLRMTYLPDIESNVFKQAMQPTPAGARLGLKVLTSLEPERWGNRPKSSTRR